MPANRLAGEKSPYLLQHRNNPVDWFPWGGEAFEKARRENKPIFLSIGYSTCHWCHVMERESFENEAVAALLNAHYVSIKVDREERPDVDRVYMTYVQASTGRGGWPMSVFLTPDLQPFVGGTYFPPEDAWGRPGFATLLRRLAQAWATNRAGILAQGAATVAALREHLDPSGADLQSLPASGIGRAMGMALLLGGFEQIARGFDAQEGGFSEAPKFPRPVTLAFVLRFFSWERERNPGGGKGARALEMALFTLRKMAAGGMHDHLGGGFHRYSVDRFWHVPHFEKMLYDQAQIVCACLDAYQITGSEDFAGVARDVLEYVRRDLTAPGGAFYSAEDADSPLPEDPSEKGEGAFYTWTQSEIDGVLTAEQAALFNRFYGVEEHGNAPDGSDPQGELAGKNTLIQRHTVEEMARLSGVSPEEAEHTLEESRRVLFGLREKRPRPHLDDKIITAWNGLMISGFARAGRVLDEPVFVEAAGRAAAFLQAHLTCGGKLIRSYREGPATVCGFADDYAFLIQGLLELYEAGGNLAWLQWAFELQQTMDDLFWDGSRGGYYSTAGDDPSILLRAREDYDGAEPSANSVAALNALRIGAMLDDAPMRRRGEATVMAFVEQLHRLPSAMPAMLTALEFALAKPKHIVFAGNPNAREGDPLDLRPLLRELHAHFIPNKTVLFADESGGRKWLATHLPFIETAVPVNGKAAAYVCEDFTCRAPATTPEELRAALPIQVSSVDPVFSV